MYAIQRDDRKVWSHNGAMLGSRDYYWLDEIVLWVESIGRPAIWFTERGALEAIKTVGGRVIEVSK